MRSLARHLGLAVLTAAACCLSALGQSTDASFPTNVSSSEVNGTINARDIGDPRLTTYYYALGGGQGDLFINVVTTNFSGDIDVFAVEGLRSLAKIVVYAQSESSETGRLIYLRKEERLLLRVQGRTPNDDPATFRIKFGGSFVALAPNETEDAPKVAKLEPNDSGVRVNSVGTIVEVLPKPTPSPRPPARTETIARNRPTPSPSPKETSPRETATPEPPKVTVSENIQPAPARAPREKPAKPAKKPARTPTTGPATVFGGKAKPKPTANPAKPAPAPKTTASKPAAPAPEKKPDPLASIRLVVLLKNGESIERPLSEVQRFSVDKGVLTVVGKDGTTFRYQILEVEKVTIE